MPACKQQRCPKCRYPLQSGDEPARCSECGRVWSEQELQARHRAKRAFVLAAVSVSLQLGLIGVPFIFDRGGFGFPSSRLGTTIFLVGFLGTPIWSMPVAWWSHLNWRATTMQGTPIRRSVTISDVLTRWILATIVMAVTGIVIAIFVWVCMGATDRIF